jgi:hypothetical protein
VKEGRLYRTFVALTLLSSSELLRTPQIVPMASSRNYALQIHKIYEWKVCGLNVLQTVPHLILDILLFCRVFSVGIPLGP